jgi:hypothetical protein
MKLRVRWFVAREQESFFSLLVVNEIIKSYLDSPTPVLEVLDSKRSADYFLIFNEKLQ